MYDLSVYQLPSTLPSTNATDPATNATNPAANATDPAANVTDPDTNTTDPAANATDPAANATDPAINATDPATNATDPATNATDPATNVTDPAANATDPTTPSGPTPLFTKEFCHPVKINDAASVEADFAQCITKASATECNSATCRWSNGTDLIPESDFCAPAVLTDDVQTIAGCISQQTDTACNGQCKWRRGKQAATDIP
jgi:hypothetical protein